MGRLLRRFEDVMAAVSFAEAGEFDTARQMLKEQKKILLALGEGLTDRKTIKYALNACKRIEASLEILYVSDGKAEAVILERLLAELPDEERVYRLIRKKGCLKKEIVDYTKAHSDILFVVVGSSESLESSCKDRSRKLSELWQSLTCPLVIVSENSGV